MKPRWLVFLQWTVTTAGAAFTLVPKVVKFYQYAYMKFVAVTEIIIGNVTTPVDMRGAILVEATSVL